MFFSNQFAPSEKAFEDSIFHLSSLTALYLVHRGIKFV